MVTSAMYSPLQLDEWNKYSMNVCKWLITGYIISELAIDLLGMSKQNKKITTDCSESFMQELCPFGFGRSDSNPVNIEHIENIQSADSGSWSSNLYGQNM